MRSAARPLRAAASASQAPRGTSTAAITSKKASAPSSSSTRITAPAMTPGRVPSTSRRERPAQPPLAVEAQEGARDRDEVVEQVGRRHRRARRVEDADLDGHEEDRAGDADRRREDRHAESDRGAESRVASIAAG